MKLSIFISGVAGGGAEKVTCSIASFFVNIGHEVELLTMSDEKPAYPLDSRVKRFCLLKERERKSFIYNNTIRFLRFLKYLLTRKPEAYLVMLPTNTIGLLSFKFLTTSKVIAAERNNPNSYKSGIQTKLANLAHKADGWVFQTAVQKDWYESRTTIRERVIIPNAINPDVLKIVCCCNRKKLIVTAGRLTNQKNHLLLIDAFCKIADKHNDYNLVIYGEGPLRQNLEAKITSLSLSDRIILPGYSENVVASVAESSLFVLSSDFEGMPNALMEAMALGLPCVSTDCGGGGARFLIKDGVNGLLVPVQDVDALANAMDRMLSNREFAESLGSEARKLCETLAPEKVYGMWEHFIEDVVNEK